MKSALKLFMSSVVLVLVGGEVVASEATIPNVFQKSQQAKAEDVNSNFTALKDAVNDNNARINSLVSTATAFGMAFEATNGTALDVLSNIKFNNKKNLAPLAAGSQLTIYTEFALNNAANCPTCLLQIRIGIVGDTAVDCVYSGTPAGVPNTPTTGSGSVTLTVPAAPGTYFISYDTTAQYSCIKTRVATATPDINHILGFINVK